MIHRLVAERLRINPQSVRAVALEVLRRWLKRNPEQDALLEWCSVLELSDDQLSSRIVDPSSEGCRLRSSSPMGFVLTDDERRRIFAQFRHMPFLVSNT